MLCQLALLFALSFALTRTMAVGSCQIWVVCLVAVLHGLPYLVLTDAADAADAAEHGHDHHAAVQHADVKVCGS